MKTIKGLFVAIGILFALSACKTDIAITGGSYLPISPRENDTLVVTPLVANLGNTSVQDVAVSVFFGIGRTAFALPDDKLPRVSLAPGAFSPVQVSWAIPQGWGNKDVTIWAEADVRRTLVESDETNNRFDLGTVRIVPVSPFVCQGSSIIQPRFQNETYQCFDVREHSETDISQNLMAATARLLLYGAYAVIDCPTNQLMLCYEHIAFVNKIQHEIQTNNVGISPVINFNSSTNPWNLIYIGMYPTKADLQADCGAGVDACAGGFRIAITEETINPPPSTIGITAGNTSYYYDMIMPNDCKWPVLHEYQHIIDRTLLKPHESWLEEMLSRLFADLHLLKLMCPNVQFQHIVQVSGGVTTPLSEPPDIRQINSNRPLDSFANLYAEGKTCREAIIMQMNRSAINQSQLYLRNLFQLMRVEPIYTDDGVARVILLSNNSEPAVLSFLKDNGCNP